MKTPISVILEEKTLNSLDKEAEKESRSRSNMINRILEEHFKKVKNEEF